LVTFGAFSKVTRCKSGTLSRRYRSNGYSPAPHSHSHSHSHSHGNANANANANASKTKKTKKKPTQSLSNAAVLRSNHWAR
jgi:hypothetical protein